MAGLTAGLFSARLGRSSVVLTGTEPGGLLGSIDSVAGVPGFPEGVPGYELGPLMQEQAMEAGTTLWPAELNRLRPQDDGWLVSRRPSATCRRAS